MALVPTRVCGPCTVCCGVPPLDTPGFQKQAGVTCRFCVEDRGCSIHEARPAVCGDWFCGWRELPRLDDAWRPDRSDLLIALSSDEVPDGLKPYASTKFIVTKPSEWKPTKPIISYVGALIEAEAAAYIAIPGPQFHHQLKSLLNFRFKDVARRRDGLGLANGILGVVAELRRGPFEPVLLQSWPGSVPLQG